MNSDIYIDILSGILSFAFYLKYILPIYLAFYLTKKMPSMPFFLAFYLAKNCDILSGSF